MNKSILTLFFGLAGCATYNYQNGQSMGYPIFRPTSTSFYGQLHAEPLADYLSVMQDECSKINRKLDSNDIQTIYTNFIGEKIYRYTCIEKSQNTSLPVRQNSYQPTVEIIPVDPIELQITPARSKSDIKPTNRSLDLISAKKQCYDLGFKGGTEKFGRCVLDLTK